MEGEFERRPTKPRIQQRLTKDAREFNLLARLERRHSHVRAGTAPESVSKIALWQVFLSDYVKASGNG
jgi:hypothetical protein